MQTILSAIDLKELFNGAKLNLSINRQYVDNLNVFPVPDGDTGTNMLLTMNATVKEAETVTDDNISFLSAAIAKGALKGARGNSGVILSQIFKGMTSVFSSSKQINTRVFAEALVAGAKKAYAAVVNPKEGTILTVIRLVGDYAAKTAKRCSDFTDFFTRIVRKGDEVLADTPRLLPVLAKAGVVDSGGQGLMFILYGMLNVLTGVEMKEPEVETVEQSAPAATDVNDYENITFTYCTEYFIVNLKKQTTLADIDKLRDKLTLIGDCVLVVGELDTVKVHVHTNTPNIALEYALQLGDLDNLKIENMREQYKKIHGEPVKKEHSEYGLLCISSGAGFRQLFNEYGADVLEGGQTMNPSVDDIVKKVNEINADTVFVMPNNKNIILACEQAIDLVSCNLVIIPTKNIVQGIAAVTAFEPMNSIAKNERNMKFAVSDTTEFEVTHAVKDADADGFLVKKGDIIALSGKIIARGKYVDEVVLDIIKRTIPDEPCVVDLYYGVDIKREEAENLAQKVSDILPDTDVRAIFGGQPHYYYFVGLA